ncbi:type I-MYXAN CRISPR-associated endonuclease Cas4/Cas1 [Lacipirellula parvula]|uniref:CRISPR-associated endonuclease Cas1 n=1 Tax=Lacipirellula parvula TaxID=2650471 RepID=A0A5K7X3Z5_9BACT|nr:type I-MYXAN CRISPR-associated endonuclease Cas1 [Lacipirellula parvula]BBO31085.1 CRISPR-associated RecB family exonuclease Cas4 / CRISPR-associated protein Cas1 [Lacipirellula parvula]
MIRAADLGDEPPIRVMALHALLYCERLFYLEEVEEIRVADGNVYAGRRLHLERVSLDDETPEMRSYDVSSEAWGVVGKVDAVRKRDGVWIAYEHKKGRCRRGESNEPLAWPSDRIQAVAYAVLVEEQLGEPVKQARVRYHADNVTVLLDIDDAARNDLRTAIRRARVLRESTERPPVTENTRLCPKCSLAVVCLPEEERLALDHADELPPRLFPSSRERHTLHVTTAKTRVGRSGESLLVESETGKQKIPIEQIDSILIHGYGQLTTQALHLCAYRGVAVDWLTFGGRFMAGTSASPGRVQQRIRQYRALTNEALCLDLSRRTVHAKVESQLKYLLRASRTDGAVRQSIQEPIDRIRAALSKVDQAAGIDSLRGLEGIAAKDYFAALPRLLSSRIDPQLIPNGRSKHPPEDRFNALLSFGYGMLFALVHRTLLGVGLEPALGFFHQPRSAAPPLVMDVVEIFRVPLVDMPVVGSVNRNQWNPDSDFTIAGRQVWLSDDGRKKAIALFEERLTEMYRHPFTSQSMSYARIVELESRLLEKEWSNAPGLYARMRMR